MFDHCGNRLRCEIGLVQFSAAKIDGLRGPNRNADHIACIEGLLHRYVEGGVGAVENTRHKVVVQRIGDVGEFAAIDVELNDIGTVGKVAIGTSDGDHGLARRCQEDSFNGRRGHLLLFCSIADRETFRIPDNDIDNIILLESSGKGEVEEGDIIAAIVEGGR